MNYKIMKLFCMFDLPMNNKKEQRAYRKFRKRLMNEGFFMMQYSIYVKTCNNRDVVETVKKKVKAISPKDGNVRLLEVTENQYMNMEFVVGTESIREKIAKKTGLIVL